MLNIKLDKNSTNLTDKEYDFIDNNSNGIQIESIKDISAGYNCVLSIESNSVDVSGDIDKTNANVGSVIVSISLTEFSKYFDVTIDTDEDSEQAIKDILKKHNWKITTADDVDDDIGFDNDYVPVDDFNFDDNFVEEAYTRKKKKRTKNAILPNSGEINYFPDYDTANSVIGNINTGADTCGESGGMGESYRYKHYRRK